MNMFKCIVVALPAFASALLMLVVLSTPRDQASTQRLNVPPGQSFLFQLSGQTMSASVPAGPDESHSFGTFVVRQDNGDFTTGALERDGSVESLHIDDFNADGRKDALFVVRCAGSGSYVSLFAILSNDTGFTTKQLPDPPNALMADYMGHDSVAVRNHEIVRRFPTYIDNSKVRIDRQWQPADLVNGSSLPFKVEPDSNASPSGRDTSVIYSVKSGKWRSG